MPAAILLEPVVVPVLRDQGPGRPRRRDAPAEGVHRNQVQAHGRRIAAALRLEDADAEVEGLGAQLQIDALAHGPPARLEHRGHHLGRQRLVGLAGCAGVHRQHRMADAVGDRGGQIERLLVEGLLDIAPLEVLELREGVGIGLDPRLALGLQRRARRAVEEPGRDVDLAGLAGQQRDAVLALGGHRQALGREVLDRKAELAGRVVDAFDLQRRGPAPARRPGRNGDVAGDVAAVRSGEVVLGEHQARGPLDHQRALAVLDCLSLLIAHHGHQMRRLARAIDAAVGIEIAVDHRLRQTPRGVGSARRGPAADSLGGEVDGAAVEVEHRQVRLRAIGHQHLGVGRPVAGQQGMGEAHAAGDVAGPCAQVLAIVGDQRHPHARDRPSGLQRAHHGVQPVGSLIGGQGHVGEHHPAAGLGRLLAGVLAGREPAPARAVLDLDHIAARAQRFQHRAQREDGGGLLGQVAVDLERPLPDHPALVVGAGFVVAGIVALAGGVGLDDLAANQVAVGHAPDLDRQPGDIDALDADAVGVLARQDHAVASEADIGRSVAEGEIGVLVGSQGLAAQRREALQQRYLVVGQPQAADAQLVAPRRHGRRALDRRRHQHEVAVALGRIQRTGHLDAVDGLGAGSVDPRPPDRKTVRLLLDRARRVGGPGMGEEGPGEPGLLARHIGGLPRMSRARSLAEQEACAQARHQGGRNGSRQDLLVTVHGERFPGRRRAPGDGSLGSCADQLAHERIFTFCSCVAAAHDRPHTPCTSSPSDEVSERYLRLGFRAGDRPEVTPCR